MPAIDARRGATRARRWPTALVATVAAASLALTGLLFARDRQNAAAATGSRANAGHDAVALATLQSLVRTLELDATLRHAGVLGFRAIAVRAVEADVVGRLDGTLETARGQWTLALGGGYACLRWGGAAVATAARGACGDDVPLMATPTVTAAQFRSAERAAARAERAALDAAAAASALTAHPARRAVRYAMPVLTAHFERITAAPFRTGRPLQG